MKSKRQLEKVNALTGEVHSLDEALWEARGANQELTKSLQEQLDVNESLNKKQEELMMELKKTLMEKIESIDSNQTLRSEIFKI